MTTRGIKFTRFGLGEDPAGLLVSVADRVYFIDSAYRREHPPAILLRTRYLNGARGPDIAAGAARVLGSSSAFPTNRLGED